MPVQHHFLEQIINVHWDEEEPKNYCQNCCDGFLLFDRVAALLQLDWSCEFTSSGESITIFEYHFIPRTVDPEEIANTWGIQWALFMSLWCSAPGALGCPTCEVHTAAGSLTEKFKDYGERIGKALYDYQRAGGTEPFNGTETNTCGEDFLKKVVDKTATLPPPPV